VTFVAECMEERAVKVASMLSCASYSIALTVRVDCLLVGSRMSRIDWWCSSCKTDTTSDVRMNGDGSRVVGSTATGAGTATETEAVTGTDARCRGR